MIPRRVFLLDTLQFASASIVLSPWIIVPEEHREHFAWALEHPSYIDDALVTHLSGLTTKYWQMLDTTAAIDLVERIEGHFLAITQFLNEARSTALYQKLGALASETAQQLGRVFHNMREFDLAWGCYAFALKMAQEINHHDWWAAGAVRLAELIIVWGEPRDALPFLEAAQKRGINDLRLRVWVTTTEMRIYAMIGNTDAFPRALDRSKSTTLPASLADDIYRTDFDLQRVVGYEGVGLMWLHESERALPLLNKMLAAYDPTSIRPRSASLAAIGRVHGQLGDVKTACKHLLESLDITAQVKSLDTLQRIYQGRGELDPWKDSADVKELDARIVEVYRSFAMVKERV